LGDSRAREYDDAERGDDKIPSDHANPSDRGRAETTLPGSCTVVSLKRILWSPRWSCDEL